MKNNLVTAIFLLENARNEKELKKVLEEMIDIVKMEADKDLVDSFTDWLEMQLKREKIENINIGKIISEKGEHNMLSETLHEILKEREKKGEKRGERRGLLKTATELLKEGLGEDFVRRVTGLSLKEIQRLKKELEVD